MASECSTEGCTKPARTQRKCNACYEYFRKHGTVDRPSVRQSTPPSARIWAHVNQHGPAPAHRPELGPCWLWTGHLGRKGYALFRWSQQEKIAAHRAMWLLLVGPIPEGLQLDHLCRVPACVNPGHLEPVTNAENMRRQAAARTHCRSGRHAWTEANRMPRKDGSVICRPCSNERVAAWKKAHR